MNLHYLVLFVALIGMVNIVNADSSEKLLVTMSFNTNDGHSPIISGYVKNESGEPVRDSTVQISSSLGTSEVKSDEDGFYAYALTDAPKENKFTVSVKAQKDGYQTGYANTSFYVNGVEQTETPSEDQSSYQTPDPAKIKNDPIAIKIMQQMELEKQKEAQRQQKLAEIEAKQKFLDEQRQIANQNLLNDLGGWFSQFDPFNPRNAFASFANQFDSGLQTIYWAQFNFTESKTNDGLAAFQQVLDSGGSLFEAKQAFYENAASSQEELNNLNNDLNARYGKNNTSTDWNGTG